MKKMSRTVRCLSSTASALLLTVALACGAPGDWEDTSELETAEQALGKKDLIKGLEVVGKTKTKPKPEEEEVCEEVLNIRFNAGMTRFSVNVRGDMTLGSILASVEARDGDFISGQTGFAQFYKGHGWFGSLEALEVGKSYLLQLSHQAELRLTAHHYKPVNAREAGIKAPAGWFWLGYTPEKAMSVSDAMSNFEASEGDMIQDETSKEMATYRDGHWCYGNLHYMAPGRGYKLHSRRGGKFTMGLTPISLPNGDEDEGVDPLPPKKKPFWTTELKPRPKKKKPVSDGTATKPPAKKKKPYRG